jgi:predicted RNase H-like nuclease
MTRDDFRRLRWLREAAVEIQPFHQRSFYSANPDLSFHQMNEDQPLKTSPFHEEGRLERLALVRDKLPGIDEVISRAPPKGAGPTHMVQAAAMLWTARRASGRAVSRLPADPTWDVTGMRVELVR